MEIRERYRQEKAELRNYVLELGRSTINQVDAALTAVSSKQPELADELVAEAKNLRGLERVIDDLSTRLIALEQPVAKDLRNIVMYIKIVADFERINKHAVSLARSYAVVSAAFMDKYVAHVEDMGRIASKMLVIIMEALEGESLLHLHEINALDSAIDDIYKSMKAKIIQDMKKGTWSIEEGIALLTLTRFMERMGDHVTNIAEWVQFSGTGEHIKFND